MKFTLTQKNIGAYIEHVTQMTSYYPESFLKDEWKTERRFWMRRECGLCKLINAPVAALHDPFASMERKRSSGMSYMSILTDPRQGIIYAVAVDKTNEVLDGGASRDTLSTARGIRAPLSACSTSLRDSPRSTQGRYIQEVR